MAILSVVVPIDSLAEKASPATAGHLASLTTDGDPADSGIVATAVSGHIASTANPHNTTAAQVGAYTTGQVDSLIAGASSPTPTLAAVLAVGNTDGGHGATFGGLLTVGSAGVKASVANLDLANGASVSGLIRFRDLDGNIRLTLSMSDAALTNALGFSLGGGGQATSINGNGLDLIPGGGVCWRSGPGGAFDTVIHRTAAGSVRVHDGTGGSANFGATGRLWAASRIGFPALTMAEIGSLPAVAGDSAYNTDTKKPVWYDGGTWKYADGTGV